MVGREIRAAEFTGFHHPGNAWDEWLPDRRGQLFVLLAIDLDDAEILFPTEEMIPCGQVPSVRNTAMRRAFMALRSS